MPEYSLHFRDMVGGAGNTGEVRTIGSLSYSDVLNTGGTCSVTIPLDIDPSSFQIGRSALYVLRDKTYMYGGPIWQAIPNLDAKTITLNSGSWLSYLGARVLDATKDYYIQDQTLIAKDLIDTMQATPGGDVGWDTSSIQPSGRTRTMETIYFYEKRAFAGLLADLGGAEDGFDYTLDVGGVAGTPSLDFRTYYPRRGRRLSTKLAYLGEGASGSNMFPANPTMDMSTTAWKVHGLGRGDGYLTPTITAIDNSFLGSWPLLERVDSWPDIGLLSDLSLLTNGSLAKHRDLLQRLVLQLRPGAEGTTPGSFSVGDQVEVAINGGWWQVDSWHRIESWTVTWDGSLERVTVEVQEDS